MATQWRPCNTGLTVRCASNVDAQRTISERIIGQNDLRASLTQNRILPPQQADKNGFELNP
jgi:hypothetical protein